MASIVSSFSRINLKNIHFSIRRNISFIPSSKTPISTISATTFDSTGTITAISKNYPRSSFLQSNNLFPRDLRKIDPTNVDVAPVIAVRRGSILVNMLFIKALVKKNGVYVFDVKNSVTGAEVRKLGVFMYDLESKLKNTSISGQPYEFKALECMLVNVMSVLEAELTGHLSRSKDILKMLDSEIDRGKLKSLLVQSKQLGVFYQKAALIRDVLDELLDNDDDLNKMYLSKNKSESTDDTSDLELLLESYYKQCDELVQRAGTMINDIKSTEDIVNIILDANRNSLMVFELRVAIFTLAITVATIIPAFYGMNLKNYLEESNIAFGSVILGSMLFGAIVSIWWLRKLAGVKRMTIVSSSSLDKWDEVQKKSMLDKIRGITPMGKANPRGLRTHKGINRKEQEKDVVWKWLVDETRK
ncbi:Mrs2 protein [Martiniozyma asiatica (nom. inval.)]|nr:Mrs2 protein [Martiniozyma asiatica]